jgi:hypothetical protein
MKLPYAKQASLTTSPEHWCKNGVAASFGVADVLGKRRFKPFH